jgi:PAS domain S-box-containing protein
MDPRSNFPEPNENIFKVFVDHAVDGMFVIDAKGFIRFANPAATALFAGETKNIVGFHLGVPAIQKPTELILPQAGGIRYVEMIVTDILWDGSAAHLASLRDVTERRHAADALRQSEEYFRRLTEDVKDYAIISLDAQGHVVTWNQGAGRIKGYDKAEIIGQSMERFYSLQDRRAGKPARLLAQAAATGRCEDEGWRVRKDGTRFYANVVLTAMHNAAGTLVGFGKITRDITEREEVEQRMRGQLEHLKLLDHITRAVGERQDLNSIFQVVLGSLEDSVRISFDCMCLYDPATNALRVSCVGAKSGALACELLMEQQAPIDVDANGLQHCVRGELVYEPDIGNARFPFPARLASVGLRSLVMAPLRSESHVLGILIAARRDANGFSSAECEFLRQLSEHVALAVRQAQLYESLKQAYDDLRRTRDAAMQEERLRALGLMASGIAHDINNALSPVSLYTESLLESEKNLSEHARGYLETIQRAVDDVAHTVARLREFYREREQQIELMPVDVNLMVQQVLALTKARWSDQSLQNGVMIQTRTELTAEIPRIMGIEVEIREALTNLVFNAVDAMPEGGTLTLRSRLVGAASSGSVIVEVADTGAGMDEDTRQKCMVPFFTTKGERGTGLGLAMVFGMAERHGASVEIDSAPGNGTTMRLRFAVAAAAPVQPKSLEALQVPARLRLLLVDDDPVLLRSLREALETDGHVIVAVDGGKAGIAEFNAALERSEPYAAVITDLGMPYVDGRKLAAAIKLTSPATPVILLTGWGQRMIVEDEAPAHVDRVLAKPPKLREVREVLAQLCRPPVPEPTA